MVFFAARAAGVRGTLAHAFANGAAWRDRAVELELAAVIAAAEPGQTEHGGDRCSEEPDPSMH